MPSDHWTSDQLTAEIESQRRELDECRRENAHLANELESLRRLVVGADAERLGQQAELIVLNRGLIAHAEDLQLANEELSAQTEILEAQQKELSRLHEALKRHTVGVESEVARQGVELQQSVEHRARLLTEQQRAVRRADQFEGLNTTILNSAGDGILGLDTDGRITFANPAAAQMLGYQPESLVGLLQASLMAEDANVFRRADGTQFQVEYLSTPLMNDLQLQGAVVTFRDVTERVEREKLLAEKIGLLQRADLYKDQFLGVLSHELRTPLNAIIGFGSILEDGLAGELEAEQAKYVGKILTSSDWLLGLVNDLLDLSRVQAGKFALDVQAVEVSLLVHETLNDLKADAAFKNLTVRNDVTAELLLTHADPRRIGQVLRNLVTNAIKYTPEGGSITVRAARRDEEVCVEVIDSGIGISADQRERIFQPFTQVDMSSTRVQGGVGLGLSICKALIEAHGGTINVDSPGEGLGSTFWFRLPTA